MSDSISAAADPVLVMEDVACGSARDPETAIVSNANWRVAAGDFWVVAGAGGSGKSDFLMTASGLLPPASGTVKFFGSALPEDESGQLQVRLKVGLVFDGGHIFNQLTLAENIALPLRYHQQLNDKEILQRVHALLELAELTPWADRIPGTLGRAWLKRAGLMRALALQPELLLVDNPLGGADVRHAEWWLGMLEQLAAGHLLMPEARPLAVVATATNLQPWRDRARQFAVLQSGLLRVLGGRENLETEASALKELLAEPRPNR